MLGKNILGSGFDFGMNLAKTRAGEANPLGLNASGLTDAQSTAFNTLGKNLFSDVSSNFAGRGFLSPDNVGGVIGNGKPGRQVGHAAPPPSPFSAANRSSDSVSPSMISSMPSGVMIIGGQTRK